MEGAVVAIPLFGAEVAPHFCSAREFLIVEIEDAVVCARNWLAFDESPWTERLSQLSARGVTVLLCGGFGHRWVPSAELKGMQVVTRLSGLADDLVTAYLAGDLERYQFPRRLRRQGRARAGWGRRGRARGKGRPQPGKTPGETARACARPGKREKQTPGAGGSGEASTHEERDDEKE